MIDAPLISRFDRAARRSARSSLSNLASLFLRDVRRAKLTPTQRDLAELICADSLEAGFTDVVYKSLVDLVMESGAAGPVLNLGRNDISLSLNGNKAKGIPGLVDYGIVRVEVAELEGQRRWLVTPQVDWRRWGCSWRVSLERRLERRLAMMVARREGAAFFPGLSPEADLVDALDAVQCGSVGVSPATLPAVSHGRSASVGVSPGAVAEYATDAPRFSPTRDGPIIRGGSEFQNASCKGSKLKAFKTCNLEDLKGKLGSDVEADFCVAARQIIGASNWDDGRPGRYFTGDGGKWRNRWHHPASRSTVLSVFQTMIEDGVGRKPGGRAESLWKLYGGPELDSCRLASKESLFTH